MKDIRANYACAVCSQTFTRKPTGIRHSVNLHLGTAQIVRLIDYIIGRIEGRYQPNDPLLYRRKNKIMNRKNAKIVYEVSSSRFTVIPDKTKESSQNDFGLGYKQDSFDVPSNNIRPKMDSIKETNQSRLQWGQREDAVYQTSGSYSETSTSRCLDMIGKFQEYANLIQKHCPKDTAKTLLVCAIALGPEKLVQNGWIDTQLVFLRNYDKIA
ncbi:MAG: hypothetical protein WB053_04885 [Nitrososphaeraceae archaeon]